MDTWVQQYLYEYTVCVKYDAYPKEKLSSIMTWCLNNF